jgi:hypothetical protein
MVQPKDDEPCGDSYLTLTWELSHIGCYSTRKSWEEVRALGSCGRLTFSCAGCRSRDVLLGSVGSTNRSKTIWHQYLYISFIMDRAIILCQKMKQRESCRVLRIDSWNLHGNRFFVENKVLFLFCRWSLAVHVSTYHRVFHGIRFSVRVVIWYVPICVSIYVVKCHK